MKRASVALLTLLGALPFWVSASTPSVSDYVDIPPDAGFPVSEARLDDLRLRGDLNAQRMHAWDLLAALAGSGRPTFLTWYGAGEVFAATSGEPVSREREGAWSLPPKPDAKRGASTAGPLITRAHYNLSAYHHIRHNQLHSARQLAELKGEVPAFPRDSVVVKSVWWPVPAEGLVALPVWDAATNPPRRGGNPYVSWARAVGVSQQPVLARQADVQLMGRPFKGVRVFSISEFCHQILDQSLAASLDADPEARRLAIMMLGRPLRAGDALVLVAMHVATREVLDWVWSTLWWHDRADEGVFAAQRPSTVQGPWRNYLMSVAFDRVLPREADGSPHVAFNPWLEGRFADQGRGNGTISNCMSCHNRASTSLEEPFQVTRGDEAPASASPQKPAVRTSSLWSLALQSH